MERTLILYIQPPILRLPYCWPMDETSELSNITSLQRYCKQVLLNVGRDYASPYANLYPLHFTTTGTLLPAMALNIGSECYLNNSLS